MDVYDAAKHWNFPAGTRPEEEKNTGAAIATGCWKMGEHYTLKSGNNLVGLRHHINISKILRRNGITSSCPLPTKDGRDFVEVDGGYYVVTENVQENFLSTRIPEAGEYAVCTRMLQRELDAFVHALTAKDADFTKHIVQWAVEKCAELGKSLKIPFCGQWLCESLALTSCGDSTDVPQPENRDAVSVPLFFCALPAGSFEELQAHFSLDTCQRRVAAAVIACLFIAWSNGLPAFQRQIAGNFQFVAKLGQYDHSEA